MTLDEDLASLKPKTRLLVFDLVEEAGFDVSDWRVSASNPAKAKANPKYCYDWSFIEPGKVAIFNLWYDAMKISDGEIVYQDNFRANAASHRTSGGKVQWITRGKKLDAAVSVAARDQLPVRVIIVDGNRRNTDEKGSNSSSVKARKLDLSPWYIKDYNLGDGACTIARGRGITKYADQFDSALSNTVERMSVTSEVSIRDPKVRRAVLERSGGQCEYCGERGFLMENGKIYLETHHIERLADGGDDSALNVVALCPNHHRQAHFAIVRDAIKASLIDLQRPYSTPT